ncbi:MAG: hypothetical protein CFE37_13285 [Alphaproteobacteria bacterium PA4]|nr:MAG: hypothetical protein CFE37_13285 [Alphaproteobacteria bacterium PA4]
MPNKPRIISTEAARGGITHQHVRLVLAVSVALAVIAMIIVYARAPVASQHGATTAAAPVTS